MFCNKCGAVAPDNSVVCPKCGASLSSVQPENANLVKQRAPKSIGGFVCGLLGFLLDWVPFVGFILSIVGVALCNKGKREVDSRPFLYQGTGLLTAGKVLGIIGIIIGSIVLVIYVVWGLILGSVGLFGIFDIF